MPERKLLPKKGGCVLTAIIRGSFSFFPSFSKSLGAGVAGTLLVRIILVIFIPLQTPLQTAMPVPPAPRFVK